MEVFFVGICRVFESGKMFFEQLRLAATGVLRLVLVDDGAYSWDCQHPDDENPPGISRTLNGESDGKHAEYGSFAEPIGQELLFELYINWFDTTDLTLYSC